MGTVSETWAKFKNDPGFEDIRKELSQIEGMTPMLELNAKVFVIAFARDSERPLPLFPTSVHL